MILGIIVILQSNSNYINFENIDWQFIIDCISAFSALIATVLVLFTLNEMQNQRKSAYQPTITIKNKNNICFKWDNGENKNNPVMFTFSNEDNLPEEISEIDKIEPKKTIRIPIFNIGAGAAKNIELTWNFNVDFFKKELEQFNDKISIEDSNNRTIFQGNNFKLMIPNNLNEFLDYILPLGIREEPEKCKIPLIFIYYYIFYAYFKSQQPNEEENLIKNIEELPILHLTIKFKDIGNNDFIQQFTLNLKHLYLMTLEDNNLGELNLLIEANEVKNK